MNHTRTLATRVVLLQQFYVFSSNAVVVGPRLHAKNYF